MELGTRCRCLTLLYVSVQHPIIFGRAEAPTGAETVVLALSADSGKREERTNRQTAADSGLYHRSVVRDNLAGDRPGGDPGEAGSRVGALT